MKWLTLIIVLFPLLVSAQQKFTLSGKVTDSATGEDLPGATIMASDFRLGTTTNSYGFYSLSLPTGEITLRASFVGYNSKEIQITLSEDLSLDFILEPNIRALSEVTVTSEKDNSNISSAIPGVGKLAVKNIETIPVLFGERDILKTIQLLPGISSSSEGNTGFNVRGGSSGQNLILLDEAPVYSSAHLLGFFSIFNSDAIKDVTLYKGGIPASYGGRASSVLNIIMNNGNSRKLSMSGGIGLVSSRLTLEVPLVKDKASFIISGRRTYADLAAKTFLPDDIISDDLQFYFYDLNAKLNYTLNSKNRLFLSGYFGRDVFELGDRLGTGWGNTTTTFRWNHLLSEKVFSNTSLIYSNYIYGFTYGDYDIRLRSGIRDLSMKEDITWYPNPGNTVKTGLDLNWRIFRPGEITGIASDDYRVALRQKRGIEGSLYIQNEQDICSKLKANYGLRLTFFSQTGPGWFYEYDVNNKTTDSVQFESMELAFPAFIPEPRISLNFMPGEKSSVKLSYSRMSQFIHLLSNTTTGTPSDIWLPVSNNLKPVIADQLSGGFFRNFLDDKIESSIEVYYKKIRNSVDYEDGAEIIFNEHVESQILSGNGRSYGVELYLRKKYGKLTGWAAYTISRTENRIEGINNSGWYPVRYDKTHDLSLVAVYRPARRITLSGVWTYTTGNAVTFPSGRYEINGVFVPYYTERNGYRMPAYHRLDLSLSIDGRNRRKWKSQWDLSVYNAYNRHNAYMITFRESEANPGTTEAVRLSLFGIVPSISYNFKF